MTHRRCQGPRDRNIGGFLVLAYTLELFGVERCMFASNYPVDGLVARFDTILSGFQSIVSGRPHAEQKALFAGNARRIYRFEQGRG